MSLASRQTFRKKLPITPHVTRRTFINQVPGVQRLFMAHMKQDLKRVSTLVILPPIMALGWIATCTVVGFVGAQWWLEHVEMAAGEPSPWGWETEREDWSGGSKGGTNPSIGMAARQLLRTAWVFQHWASSMGQQPVENSPYNDEESVLHGGDRGYYLSERQIAWSMEMIENRKLAVPEAIRIRHAEVLERLNTFSALKRAQEEWLQLYNNAPSDSFEAAKLALKLGNLSARLGDTVAAESYWLHALNVPTSTPAIERHLSSTYLSLSSFYSIEGQLDHAWDIQRSALMALGSFLPTTPTVEPSADERLHLLYLTQRASLFSIHHAEVQYARTRDVESSISRLNAAAESASSVAHALCDSTPSQPDSINPNSPLGAKKTLSKSFSGSKTLNTPASALLRDARRAAMQAYYLKGMLLEKTKKPEALECYRTALAWGGHSPTEGAKLGIPEREMTIIHQKYKNLQLKIDIGLD